MLKFLPLLFSLLLDYVIELEWRYKAYGRIKVGCLISYEFEIFVLFKLLFSSFEDETLNKGGSM